MNKNTVTLDNPVWHALNGPQQALGQANSQACRYHPDIAPFAALVTPTPQAMLALRDLMDTGEHVAVQSLTPLPTSRGFEIDQIGFIRQMVAVERSHDAPVEGVLQLGLADREDMQRLVLATRPGPFAHRTPEMGNYIGIRHEGQLIAMAGERMRVDGFTEISAVCVDDAWRGRGLAGRLVNTLRATLLQRGEIPFLHVLEDNLSALTLYRRLGFEDRQRFLLNRLERVG